MQFSLVQGFQQFSNRNYGDKNILHKFKKSPRRNFYPPFSFITSNDNVKNESPLSRASNILARVLEVAEDLPWSKCCDWAPDYLLRGRPPSPSACFNYREGRGLRQASDRLQVANSHLWRIQIEIKKDKKLNFPVKMSWLLSDQEKKRKKEKRR